MTAGNQPSSSGSEQPRLSPDMVLQEARSLVAHLNSLNKPYSSGVVADCIATIENLVSRLPSAAQRQPEPLATALQKCSGALGTFPEKLKIAFTGDWAHLGSATIGEILDEANHALSAVTPSPGPGERADRLEDERNRLQNSYGSGPFADGLITRRIVEIDKELSSVSSTQSKSHG